MAPFEGPAEADHADIKRCTVTAHDHDLLGPSLFFKRCFDTGCNCRGVLEQGVNPRHLPCGLRVGGREDLHAARGRNHDRVRAGCLHDEAGRKCCATAPAGTVAAVEQFTGFLSGHFRSTPSSVHRTGRRPFLAERDNLLDILLPDVPAAEPEDVPLYRYRGAVHCVPDLEGGCTLWHPGRCSCRARRPALPRASAFAISSDGNGRKTRILRSPTFLPAARISSIASLMVPQIDPMATIAVSASSRR